MVQLPREKIVVNSVQYCNPLLTLKVHRFWSFEWHSGTVRGHSKTALSCPTFLVSAIGAVQFEADDACRSEVLLLGSSFVCYLLLRQYVIRRKSVRVENSFSEKWKSGGVHDVTRATRNRVQPPEIDIVMWSLCDRKTTYCVKSWSVLLLPVYRIRLSLWHMPWAIRHNLHS